MRRRVGLLLAAVLLIGARLPISGAAAVSTPARTLTLRVLWHTAGVPGSFVNEPTLWQQRVISTSDNTATARDLTSGHVAWKVKHADELGSPVTVGQPVLYDGVIDAPLDTVGGGGSVDYNPATGAFTITGPMFHAFRGVRVVKGSMTALISGSYGSNFGPLYELGFGGRSWFVEFGPGVSIGVPAISQGRAFVQVGGAILGFDPAQPCVPVGGTSLCEPTWQTATPGTPRDPSAAGPGRVAAADDSGVVSAFDATSGSVVWTSANLATALGPTAYADGTLYVGGADGVVRAIDPATGVVTWTGNAGAAITTAATVAAGRVYVATTNGRLVTFPAAGCAAATCAALAIGNAALPGTTAAGAPLIRNHVAIVAYADQLVAFSV